MVVEDTSRGMTRLIILPLLGRGGGETRQQPGKNHDDRCLPVVRDGGDAIIQGRSAHDPHPK